MYVHIYIHTRAHTHIFHVIFYLIIYTALEKNGIRFLPESNTEENSMTLK